MDNKSKELRKFINESRKFVNEEWFEKKRGLTEEEQDILFKEVAKFNEYGDAVYRDQNLKTLGRKLEALTEFADAYLNEHTDAAFDKITINRNLKELRKYVKEFRKVADDIQEGQDRMEALYEDIGLIFNRYFDIKDSVEKGEELLDDPAEDVVEKNKKQKVKDNQTQTSKEWRDFDISDQYSKE